MQYAGQLGAAMKRYALAIVFGVLLGGGIAECGARRETVAFTRQLSAASYTADSLKARLAEAIMSVKPRVDTVRTIVTRTKTLRDSVVLNVTDTLQVLRYVWRTDSLRAECLKCAALLDTIQERYGDERRATNTYISLLQGEVHRVRVAAKRQSLTSRFGFSCGYGTIKVGSDLKAGPGCMASVRVFP